MRTTVELPDDLVKEIKLRALHEGKKLKDTVADLLRKGLGSAPVESRAVTKGDQTLLDRRRQIAEKFISGEWGVELVDFEAGRAADRESAHERTDLWRK